MLEKSQYLVSWKVIFFPLCMKSIIFSSLCRTLLFPYPYLFSRVYHKTIRKVNLQISIQQCHQSYVLLYVNENNNKKTIFLVLNKYGFTRFTDVFVQRKIFSAKNYLLFNYVNKILRRKSWDKQKINEYYHRLFCFKIST